MSKNRTIPFGYMMQNGEITTNPTEVFAVVTIFSDYLAGHSLLDIAKRMEVPYSEGAVWNKNMVKRILENEKYLGTDKFPQLISEEMFRAVNEKKSRKATSLCVLPEDMKTVRNLAVCRECGGKLFRKNELWDCRNSGCYRFSFQLTDQMLTGAVLTVLNSAIANPRLLECDSEVGRYAPDDKDNLDLMFASLDDPTQTMDSILSYIISGRGEFGKLDDWGEFLSEVHSCGEAGKKGQEKEITVQSWRKFERVVKKSIYGNYIFYVFCIINMLCIFHLADKRTERRK